MNDDLSSENTILTKETIYNLVKEYPYNVEALIWDFGLMGITQGEVMELLTSCIKQGLIYIDSDGFLDVVL